MECPGRYSTLGCEWYSVSSLTGSTARIRSTGYGKGRLRFTYNISGNCSAETSAVDVFKTFTHTNDIVGPACIRPNEPVAFSINPIISTASQIAAEIGVDRYEWKINGVALQSLSTIGWGINYVSGDSSSITITAPAALAGSPVISVGVGKWNFATPRTKTVITKANVPVFVGNIPSCIPTNSTAPFTLSVNNEPGVTYAWKTSANWTVSAPVIAGMLNTVTITPDNNPGEVTVTASTAAGCESAVNTRSFSRQLSAGRNSITGGTGCLTVGTPVTFTLTNAPLNSTFDWTAPAGWTPVTATGASATFTPTASAVRGPITVRTSDTACSALAGISVTPAVFNNQGLSFSVIPVPPSIFPSACNLFAVVTPDNFNTSDVTYTWYLNGVQRAQTTGTNNLYSYGRLTGALTVSVTKPFPDCLNATVPGVTYNSTCLLLPTGRIGNIEPTDAALESSVEVFPNPAQSEVTLQLPNLEQVKEITLFDLTGKVRKRLSTLRTSHTLPVNELPSGTYFLQVKIGKKLVTKKVVLIK